MVLHKSKIKIVLFNVFYLLISFSILSCQGAGNGISNKSNSTQNSTKSIGENVLPSGFSNTTYDNVVFNEDGSIKYALMLLLKPGTVNNKGNLVLSLYNNKDWKDLGKFDFYNGNVRHDEILQYSLGLNIKGIPKTVVIGDMLGNVYIYDLEKNKQIKIRNSSKDYNKIAKISVHYNADGIPDNIVIGFERVSGNSLIEYWDNTMGETWKTLHDMGFASGVKEMVVQRDKAGRLQAVIVGLLNSAIEKWAGDISRCDTNKCWSELHGTGWSSKLSSMYSFKSESNPFEKILVGLKNGSIEYWNGKKWTELRNTGWQSSITNFSISEDSWRRTANSTEPGSFVVGLGNGAIMYYNTLTETWTQLHDSGWSSPVLELASSWYGDNLLTLTVRLENGALEYILIPETDSDPFVNYNDSFREILPVNSMFTDSKPYIIAGNTFVSYDQNGAVKQISAQKSINKGTDIIISQANFGKEYSSPTASDNISNTYATTDKLGNQVLAFPSVNSILSGLLLDALRNKPSSNKYFIPDDKFSILNDRSIMVLPYVQFNKEMLDLTRVKHEIKTYEDKINLSPYNRITPADGIHINASPNIYIGNIGLGRSYTSTVRNSITVTNGWSHGIDTAIEIEQTIMITKLGISTTFRNSYDFSYQTTSENNDTFMVNSQPIQILLSPYSVGFLTSKVFSGTITGMFYGFYPIKSLNADNIQFSAYELNNNQWRLRHFSVQLSKLVKEYYNDSSSNNPYRTFINYNESSNVLNLVAGGTFTTSSGGYGMTSSETLHMLPCSDKTCTKVCYDIDFDVYSGNTCKVSTTPFEALSNF